MDRIIKTKARLQYNCNFRGKRICPSGETEIRGVATSCEYLDAPPAVTNITPPKNGGLVCYTTMGSKYCAARYVESGGSRIYRRVASTSWGGGAPTPEAVTFRIFCMSKRKNLGSGSCANGRGYLRLAKFCKN